ncbi:MAG: serine/threonine protein kinase [Desulfurococcaceae archaeon]
MAEKLFAQGTTLDGEVHFLEKPDSYVARVLCYPRESCTEMEERLRALISDGFVYLVETGVRVINIRVLGKGYTGVTTAAFHRDYGLGALKLLRLDSRRRSLVHEAEMLMRVQEVKVAPRLYAYRDFYVFREYIPVDECTPVSNYISTLLNNGRVEELKNALRSILRSLHELDVLGVDHTEIGRPGGHVFYCLNGLRVLDWDSAKLSRKPVNLTSFASFLLYRFIHAEKLRGVLGYEISEVLHSLKNYKRTYSANAFTSLLSALRLL